MVFSTIFEDSIIDFSTTIESPSFSGGFAMFAVSSHGEIHPIEDGSTPMTLAYDWGNNHNH